MKEHRRQYRNPPVHEVIIDLQFAGALNRKELDRLPSLVGSAFGQTGPIQRVSQHTLLKPHGLVVNRPPNAVLWGWEFTTEEPHRVTTVSANQLTQHFLRSDDWPRGSYVGWEAHADAFTQLTEAVRDAFSDLAIRRAGVRYINRIAVPAESSLDEWFTVVPAPHPDLEELWDLKVSRTWARSKERPHLSGTVSLSRIQDPPLDDARDGEAEDAPFALTLDIEVFNLYVRNAPSFDEISEWIEEAHKLENRIFEHCITEALAERFDPIQEDRRA